MNDTAIFFSSKDRTDLSAQTIESLLQPGLYDTYWVDGSKMSEGTNFPYQYLDRGVTVHPEVRGGADAAIVYSLTQGLTLDGDGYDYIGLVENDVLLPPDWYPKTKALFTMGFVDGLEVGAVSARCYKNRILIQRPHYAVCHNLGAGMIVFSRRAAEIALHTARTAYTLDNRAIFAALSDVDITSYWFRGAEQHWITLDWGIDAALARHGLASLALTPQIAEMIDADINTLPIDIRYADAPVAERMNESAFRTYVERAALVRAGELILPQSHIFRDPHSGQTTIFPHQFAQLGANFEGPWRLHWVQGYGPFAYVANPGASVTIPIQGPCGIQVASLTEDQETRGQFEISDPYSGFLARPPLAQQMINVAIPGPPLAYRPITITCLRPNAVLLAVNTSMPPLLTDASPFNWTQLPPVEFPGE